MSSPPSHDAYGIARLKGDATLSASDWGKQFVGVEDGSAWLAEGDAAEKLKILRRNVDKGLPCGAERFIQTLGTPIGRPLVHCPQGRPKKISDDK